MRQTTNTKIWLPRLFAAVLAAALLRPAPAAAQAPRLGEIQRLPVITIALRVGSMEKESRQVSYTPPPGWYVRSHSVECTVKYGNTSYTVNTVPQDWQWSSEEKIQDAYQYLIDLAAQAKNLALQTRFAHERDYLLRELHKVRSSHHALVVDATVKGEGFWRGGGGLQLTVL